MAETTSKPVPASVQAFNSKVADLIKAAQPSDLAEIMSHPSSLLKSAAADNNNQNQGRRAE